MSRLALSLAVSFPVFSSDLLGLAHSQECWHEESVSTALFNPQNGESADLDGDGDMDLVIASFLGSSIDWVENEFGDASSWIVHSIDGAASLALGVHTADIDGDGDLDVIGGSNELVPLVWYDNLNGDASVWLQRPIPTAPGAPGRVNRIDAGDVDGDLDTDVLWIDPDAGEAYVARNLDGLGTTWSNVQVFDHSNTLFAPGHLRDMDGDLDLDVLLSSDDTPSDEILWFENVFGDATSWVRHSVYTTTLDFRDTCVDDLDGDGDLDVVATEGAGAFGVLHHVGWTENVAGDASVWTHHTMFDLDDKSSVESLDVGDVDADGDLDVISSSMPSLSPANLSWYENAAGDGTSWISHNVSTSASSNNSIGSDLDGDGDLEIVSLSVGPKRVTWLERVSGPAASAVLRLDAAGANSSQLSSEPPVLGDEWTTVLQAPFGQNASGGISGFAAPLDLFLPAFGFSLLVDITDPGGELLGSPFATASPDIEFVFDIPNDMRLLGTAFSIQGYTLGQSGPQLYNAVDLVIGCAP